MSFEYINSLTGVIGAATGLVAVIWSCMEHYPRPGITVGFGGWLDRDKTTKHGYVITVVNRGRSPLVLHGVGMFGVACSANPLEDAKQWLMQRRTLPRRIRRAMDRSSDQPEGGGNALIVAPFDTYEAQFPCSVTSELNKISGRYWGVQVIARTGKRWRVNGDAINRGERRLPQWILRRLPDRLRLRSWRYKQIELF